MPPVMVSGSWVQMLYLPDSRPVNICCLYGRFVCFKLSELDRELEEMDEDLDEDVITAVGLEENSKEGAELLRKISSEPMSSLFVLVTFSLLDGDESVLELDRDESFLAFLLRSLFTCS